MKILDRYIVKTMASYTSVVMFIWLGVYAFFNFLEEVKFIGQFEYSTLEATKYVLSDLPAVMYSHSSVVILLGSLLAIGHLASTSQLVILRSAGLSIIDITKIVVRGSLVFIAIILFIGEGVAPFTTEYAERERARALGHDVISESNQGFWLKDGRTIIRVENNFDGQSFGKVTLINLSQSSLLDKVLFSEIATFDGEFLNLKEVQSYQIKHQKKSTDITQDKLPEYKEQVSFDQDLLDSLEKEPYEMSTWGIYKQINFLKNNNLNTDIFEVELYKRIIKPVTLIAMILISMSFMFGSLRDASLGKKVFFGLMISMFFELFSRVGGVLSLRFDYNHFLSASAPTLVVASIALLLLYRQATR